ncbi:MAG: cupin domain-containing protein [Gammaproteobacteria bacterium]
MTKPAAQSDEYYTDERCHILELMNTPDYPEASIARARVEPGVTTKQHRVTQTTERYVILQGEGTAMVDGQPDSHVSPGDEVVIPPGFTQSIVNTGESDLVFLCICTPRFEWDNYVSLEADDE